MASNHQFFYTLKPIIPRPLQIFLRQLRAKRLRKKFAYTWPIDSNSAYAPTNWPGWPDNKKFAFVLTHDVDTKRGLELTMQLATLEREIGVRSVFNFIPEDRYKINSQIRMDLKRMGFDVGVHGLKHDGKLFNSLQEFEKRAPLINHYLKDWGVAGFSSPSMHHNLNWMHKLNIEYSTSTFDTDPFEPQPDSIGTIFPLVLYNSANKSSFVEIPLTMVQDFTLFIILKEKTLQIWEQKINWIAEHGGMVVLNTHPDYMNFGDNPRGQEEYPVEFYLNIIRYVQEKFRGLYWQALPSDVAQHCKLFFSEPANRSELSKISNFK